MRIRFSPQAADQVVKASAWWRHNRPLAPRLFDEELKSTLHLLRTTPLAGTRYSHRRRQDVRRVLLLRTRYHLYYSIDGEAVTILSVWSALRGQRPKL